MEDTPIKSLDINPRSSTPTPLLTDSTDPESPIPRRKKPVPEPEISAPTDGTADTNGHVKVPLTEVLQNGHANGIKKRSASDALGTDALGTDALSPSSKRSKTASGSNDATTLNDGIIVLDDGNDGAIMIDDD